eukprot:2964359-Rhodomonas_salina.1
MSGTDTPLPCTRAMGCQILRWFYAHGTSTRYTVLTQRILYDEQLSCTKELAGAMVLSGTYPKLGKREMKRDFRSGVQTLMYGVFKPLCTET